MICCDKFGKLLELGFIFKGDKKEYLVFAQKGAERQVLTLRFCPLCGEGPIKTDDDKFWEMMESEDGIKFKY